MNSQMQAQQAAQQTTQRQILAQQAARRVERNQQSLPGVRGSRKPVAGAGLR